MEIEWKVLQEFPDYEVSNTGAVVSNRCGNRRLLKGTVKTWKGEYPQRRYKLINKNNKPIGVYASHLVAWAFLGEQPKGTYIHHWDGDTLNDCADNLAYRKNITPYERLLDSIS